MEEVYMSEGPYYVSPWANAICREMVCLPSSWLHTQPVTLFTAPTCHLINTVYLWGGKTEPDTSAISVRSHIEFSDLFWVFVLAASPLRVAPGTRKFCESWSTFCQIGRSIFGRHRHTKVCVFGSLHKPWRVECEHWCISASRQGLVALFGEDAEMYLNMLLIMERKCGWSLCPGYNGP